MLANQQPGLITDRVLGITAGAMGILSMFLPWVSVSYYGLNLLQVLDLTNELHKLGYSPAVQLGSMAVSALVILGACIALLIAGSLISFAHRAGGALLLLSWITYAVGFYLLFPPELRILLSFGLGFFMAVIASIICLARYPIAKVMIPIPRMYQPVFVQQPAVFQPVVAPPGNGQQMQYESYENNRGMPPPPDD